MVNIFVFGTYCTNSTLYILILSYFKQFSLQQIRKMAKIATVSVKPIFLSSMLEDYRMVLTAQVLEKEHIFDEFSFGCLNNISTYENNGKDEPQVHWNLSYTILSHIFILLVQFIQLLYYYSSSHSFILLGASDFPSYQQYIFS